MGKGTYRCFHYRPVASFCDAVLFGVVGYACCMLRAVRVQKVWGLVADIFFVIFGVEECGLGTMFFRCG